LTLRDAGNGVRAIARALGISRGAVKRVLVSGDARPPPLERAEKGEDHREDILALLADCKGNLVRVHEELAARGIVTMSYPALTAFCRKHGIGHVPAKPAGRYPFEPGKEIAARHLAARRAHRRRVAPGADRVAGVSVVSMFDGAAVSLGDGCTGRRWALA
jgi:hypothetical protein